LSVVRLSRRGATLLLFLLCLGFQRLSALILGSAAERDTSRSVDTNRDTIRTTTAGGKKRERERERNRQDERGVKMTSSSFSSRQEGRGIRGKEWGRSRRSDA